MKIIGIGGGSGSGKSTVSHMIAEENPELFEVINLDDYQKLPTDPGLPMFNDMINWDHPDVIRWDDLISDIELLKNGQPVTIKVWTEKFNPYYHKTGIMVPRTINPKPTMIVDGYLALYNPSLYGLFERKYYLDLDAKTRMKRRAKGRIIRNPDYEANVLPAMHDKYVEPTKQNADVVIDVSGLSIDQVKQKILEDLGSV